MKYMRAYKHPKSLIYIINTHGWYFKSSQGALGVVLELINLFLTFYFFTVEGVFEIVWGNSIYGYF